MASVARSLTRTALSFARQTSSRQKSRCPRCLIPVQPRRPFSVTPLRFRELDEQAEDELAESEFDSEEPSKLQTSEFNLSEFNFKAWDDEEVLEDETRREIDADVDKIETQMPLNFMENSFVKVKPGFWAEGEEDEMAEVEDEEQKDDAITSMAHTQLEEHRELREYARIVAWDMPSLSSMLYDLFSLTCQADS
jgi:small subunit ribosomal protein S35